MNVNALVAASLGALLLGGCAADRFTESDEGTTKVVTRGDTFSISLASTAAAPPPEPHVEGAYLRFVGRRSDVESGRDVFQFSAEGVGEAEIRIRPPGTPAGSPSEYVLRVRVDPGGKEPSSRPLQQNPHSY
jgi:hypothetical protein